MVCLPLIERELRAALRKQRPERGRLKVAALAVGGSLLGLYFSHIGDRSAGQGTERIFYVAGLYFVLRAPMLTAGVLAEERRNQTLGLLFLSGLGAWEVFASKFLSSALIAFTNLLAIFPVLALPFLIGGVSYNLFVAIICALPVLMFFALAVSLLASVLTREDVAALVLANVMGALLCLLPPAIYFALSHFPALGKPSLWWLRVSPAYGPYLVWEGFGSGFHGVEQAEFWQNLALTAGWSALALVAAAFALKRVWREDGVETGFWRKKWRELAHGGRESRRRLGRAWLDENPYVWLAGRDRQPAMLAWLVAGGIVLAWLGCWALWPGQWLSPTNFYLTAALLNVAQDLLTRHAAAKEIGQARRDGAYELLLTTPLTPSDIAHGTLDAVRWRFRGMADFILALNVVMMLWGLALRGWNTGALFVYFSFWLILLTWSWCLGHRWARLLPVMWASLNCGRPAYAVWRATGAAPSGNWWYWIWFYNVCFWLQAAGRGYHRFPTGSGGELVIAWCVVIVWLVWFVSSLFVKHRERPAFEWDSRAKEWIGGRASKSRGRERVCESRLFREFRDVAREPLPEANDPRFKKWDARERFPWGFPKGDLELAGGPGIGEEEARVVEFAIIELIQSGDKEGAVKLARQTYGYPLYQAVAFVDKLESRGKKAE
jgi:ABC-type transport system involved in multi-copper enzyme maturation permease subunit